jgi:uncharacterized protein involved in exopolysaccharide biosynthesis
MEDQEFSPRLSLERAFQRWWIILLLTALGGITGWAIHFLRPPLYESTAVITANMDFQKVPLTQEEEDYAFNAAGAIGSSYDVKNQVVTDAQAQGLPIDMNQLPDQMDLERKQSVWEFHITNRDPGTAAKLANLWAEKTLSALNAALGHAMQADQIQTQINTITGSQPTSGSPAISLGTLVVLQNLSTQLLQEKQLSRGVISIMKFALSSSATPPLKPVLNNLADLVLAGACIGFIVSLWAVGNYQGRRRG